MHMLWSKSYEIFIRIPNRKRTFTTFCLQILRFINSYTIELCVAHTWNRKEHHHTCFLCNIKTKRPPGFNSNARPQILVKAVEFSSLTTSLEAADFRQNVFSPFSNFNDRYSKISMSFKRSAVRGAENEKASNIN